MRTAEVKIYSYSELSEDAKEHAWQNWLAKGVEYPWDGEARETIDALENALGIAVRRWRFDSSGHDFDLSFEGWNEDALNLRGNRARSYLWNNFGHLLLQGRYYKKWHGTKHAHSRFWLDRVYDGTCPLTGVCFDCDALDPLAYFCFGVKWDETQKKRIPIRPTIAQDNANTVEDIIRECVDSLFSALERDWAWCESQEYFAEHAEANGYEFTEDGEYWCEVAA